MAELPVPDDSEMGEDWSDEEDMEGLDGMDEDDDEEIPAGSVPPFLLPDALVLDCPLTIVATRVPAARSPRSLPDPLRPSAPPTRPTSPTSR